MTPKALSMAFVTIQPGLITASLETGLFQRATCKGLAALQVKNLRDSAQDRHGTVDDRPYGGGDGMVLRPDILARSLTACELKNPFVVYPTPAGERFSQAWAARLLALGRPLIFICGRFAGCDQRFVERYVDAELSCGDYVVSGGELPSLLMADAILRLVPGVLGHEASAANDSFGTAHPQELEGPVYTRPATFEGVAVPQVLTSGDHCQIAAWRRQQAVAWTRKRRPDLACTPSPQSTSGMI